MYLWEGFILSSVIIGFVGFLYVALRGWEDSDDGYF